MEQGVDLMRHPGEAQSSSMSGQVSSCLIISARVPVWEQGHVCVNATCACACFEADARLRLSISYAPPSCAKFRASDSSCWESIKPQGLSIPNISSLRLEKSLRLIDAKSGQVSSCLIISSRVPIREQRGSGQANSDLQGYLAHKKHSPPRTLQ